MKKRKFKKKWLFPGGFILILISLALTLVLLSKNVPFFRNLWASYDLIKLKLIEYQNALEMGVKELGITWEIIAVIIMLFIGKTFIPVYFTTTVCAVSAFCFPGKLYISIPLNVFGMFLLFSIKYFWGKKFGPGFMWKRLRKSDTIRSAIETDGKGNHALLVALRIVPGTPINVISSAYGSIDFGYWKFLGLSMLGFMPRLISFSVAGSNVFDPLGAGFLIPIIVLTYLTGMSFIGANGIWTAVEWVTDWINKRKIQKKKQEIRHQQKLEEQLQKKALNASDNKNKNDGSKERKERK